MNDGRFYPAIQIKPFIFFVFKEPKLLRIRYSRDVYIKTNEFVNIKTRQTAEGIEIEQYNYNISTRLPKVHVEKGIVYLILPNFKKSLNSSDLVDNTLGIIRDPSSLITDSLYYDLKIQISIDNYVSLIIREVWPIPYENRPEETSSSSNSSYCSAEENLKGTKDSNSDLSDLYDFACTITSDQVVLNALRASDVEAYAKLLDLVFY